MFRADRKIKKQSLYILVFLWFLAFCGDAFGDYCSASGEDYDYEHISGVEVGTISNMTGWSSYTDYTYLSTEMYIGYDYSITVTNGDPYSGDQCGVWVDWNADEDFDDVNETIVMSGGPGTFTGTITPPEGAALGSTRMRVRIMWTGVLSPCGVTDYGEVEDYTLIVSELISQEYGGGSGTTADPYLIYTAEHMNMIGVGILDWDKHFKLMADIDLSAYTGTSFNIIGSEVFPFRGVFDGAGHRISNFTYESPSASFIGVFGYIDDVNAEVRDLGMIEPDINVGQGIYFGPIAGYLSGGSIRNCYVEGGSIGGNGDVGGLVGIGKNNRISNCCSSCDVTGGSSVGGLVGSSSYGNISNCYSTGNVAGGNRVGGLVGNAAYNSIEGCYSTSNVTGGNEVGGLVGCSSDNNILNCHSSGDVAGSLSEVGGLVGDNHDSYISGCYSSSTVTGRGMVGGLVGSSDSNDTIFDCYSTGSVTGGGQVGGLVGDHEHSSIFNCYSTASVDGNTAVGGLVGDNFIACIVDCYSTGNVTGQQRVGGLVGHNAHEGSIADCYSKGGVTGQQEVGGLVGRNHKVISNCYATGTVSGDCNVGGLVGLTDQSAETYHCYSAGFVYGNDFVGGLVGYADNSDDYTACFWDSDVSPGLSGIGNRSDPGVTGQSTANMQTRSTFTNAGWDFIDEVINGPNDIWDICEGTNYPKFVWQIPEVDFVCPDGVNFLDYSFFAEHWGETDYGDVNGVELSGDGRVNWEDFGLFAGWWMASGCGECGGADFTGEGNVDYLDLDVFAGYWLKNEYGDCDGAELTGDGVVGLDDLREFTENWLAGL